MSDACTCVQCVAVPAARIYESVLEGLSRFRFLFNLYQKLHSNSCTLLVMHTWAWAWAWEGLDLCGRCDSTMFNQLVEFKGISSEQGIHFFEGVGKGEAAGQGRPGKSFAKGVCIHVPIGVLKVSHLPQRFSNRQPQRGSAPVDKAPGCGTGFLGSIPSAPVLTFLPKLFRKVAPPSHPPISIPSPVHTSPSGVHLPRACVPSCVHGYVNGD